VFLLIFWRLFISRNIFLGTRSVLLKYLGAAIPDDAD